MSNKHLHGLLAIAMAACLMTSCQSPLNLSDVDYTMGTHLELSLPIGTVQMKFGDLLKLDSNTTLTVEQIDTTTVLCLGITPEPDTTRRFSIFDFSEKIDSTEFNVNMYEHLKNVTYVVRNPATGDTVFDPTGKPVEMKIIDVLTGQLSLPDYFHFDSVMTFDLRLRLRSINRPGDHERVDSISFTESNFAVSIDKQNFTGIDPSWIDSIVLELSDQFDLHGGSRTRIIYSPSSPAMSFGKDVPFSLENLTMKFMEDESKTPSFYNIQDSVFLSARIKYHINGGTNIAINDTSRLNCKFKVGKLEPVHIWGWFTPYKDMYDDGEFPLDINFDELPFLKDPSTVLPFSRPELTATVRTQIAGVIKMDGDYMSATDSKGVAHWACFQPGAGADSVKFYYTFPMDSCIDPTTMSSIHDTTHLSITFDKDFGHMQNLFEGGIPTKVKYKFLFSFDSLQTPQIRIPMNTFVHLYSKAKLPFTFQKDFNMKYTETADNLSISEFNIDSLLGETVRLNDSSQLGIIMTTKSTVPLHIKLNIRCYDESGNVLMDPEDPSKVFTMFKTISGTDTIDYLDIYPPEVTQSKDSKGAWTDQWSIVPNAQVNTAHLTPKQIKGVFPKTKSIRYEMVIDDTNLQQEDGSRNWKELPLGKDQQLSLTIGLTADLKGALQLVNNNK